MTTPDATRTLPLAPSAEERRLGLAVRTELRLNSVRALTTAMLCATALIWAALSTDQFNGLLTLWAALAWYRFGRADTIEREELRASLGLSRADRVRGRVVLVLAEQAVVVTTVTVGAVLSVALGRDSTGGAAPFVYSGDPTGPQLWIVLAGALFSSISLLVTGLVVGGDCTTRRPGRSLAVLSLLSYFLVGLLLTIPLLLMSLTLSIDPWDGSFGTPVIARLLAAAVLALLLLLRARARRWIRELDSTPS